MKCFGIKLFVLIWCFKKAENGKCDVSSLYISYILFYHLKWGKTDIISIILSNIEIIISKTIWYNL